MLQMHTGGAFCLKLGTPKMIRETKSLRGISSKLSNWFLFEEKR